MPKELLIIFVKNILLGKVKTRLAKSIGDQAAFTIYKELVEITENAVAQSKSDRRVYFSDVIIQEKFAGSKKYVQTGADLGERMFNAFKEGFEDGYENIVLIGSDLPDLKGEIIEEALAELNQSDFVFGPAKDGGYYLIGMKENHLFPFQNKVWSQSELLKQTIEEISLKNLRISKLKELNDIDTLKDYQESSIYKEAN